jgi:hypothetical protein
MDPKRYMEGDDAAFETQLVRAARRDGAPDGAAQRAAVALGIGAGAAALSSGAGAAGLSAGVTSAKLGLLGIGKWFGIGILSGVVATTAFHYAVRPSPAERDERSTTLQESARPPRPTPAPSTPVAVPPPPPSPGAPESDTTNGTTEASTAVAKAGAEPAAPRRPSVPKATARGESSASAEPAAPAEAETRLTSLSAELALLQEARRALVAHDPARVLAELQRYSGTPRSGLLDSEADVLRVEALVQAGRRPEAVSLATSALNAAPEGPHAARFRRIIGEGAP